MKINLRRLRIAMRITLSIYLTIAGASLLFAVPSKGQSVNKRISISFKRESLKQALKKLEQQSETEFAYDASYLNLNSIEVSGSSYSNERLGSILQNLLEPNNIRFKEEVYGTISLYKKETVKQVSGTIRGTVVDDNGDPLPGATVRLLESDKASQTDMNGAFSIQTQPGTYTLVITFISYEQKRLAGVKVKANEPADLGNIVLKASLGSLKEILVVGYGTQKKENLTGAVDQVSASVLENRSLPNLTQGLQGVLPNLNLVPLDGKPIQSPSFNIRGITSIGQGGNALVLIDGVEGDPSRINPNDVASVSILKDASSAAIYGARAAFGVVLITTKNPAKEKTIINYSFNRSVKKPVTVPDLVTSGYQFAKLFNEGWSAWNDYNQTPQNINKTVVFSQDYLDELKRREEDPSLPRFEINNKGEYVYYYNTDWYKELYKDNNNASEHNVSVAGNSGKLDFLLSGRYYAQGGLFRYNSDDYKLYNLRAKVSLQVLPWLNVMNNADYSSMLYHNPLNVGEGGGIWRNIADEGHNMAPLVNPDGNLSYSSAYTVGDFLYGKNGIDFNNRVFRNTTSLSSKFLDNQLRVKGDFTFQNTDKDEFRRRVPVPYSRKPGVEEYVGTGTNDLQVVDRQTQYLAANVYTEYEPKLGNPNHFLKALVGLNSEQSVYESATVTRNGLFFEDASNINLALGQSISTSGEYEQWNIIGGFYRLNYSYKDKYLFEANGRYDGSSKFPADQRFAFFPSVSAGWRVNNESFWKISPKIISNFKIRGSYGSLGNGSINSYEFQERFRIVKSERVLNGVKPQTTSNPDVLPDGLTWETSTTSNIGLDMGFLQNRLTVVADYYLRYTTDMFTVGKTLPAVFGATVPKGNYADLKTKGWEVSVAWRDQVELSGKPFSYGFRATLADYRAEITKYNNELKNLDDYYVGQKLGEIWGYVTDGYYLSEEDVKNSPAQPFIKASKTGTSLPGDLKFKNLNGDDVIDYGDNTVSNPGDRRVIGNETPRYTYGLGLNADWNNFSFSAFIQGVGKRDWYPGREASLFWGPYNRPYNRVPKSMLDNMWSEENPDAYFPRLRGYVAQNSAGELSTPQTKYLQNTAYIRLKNVQLGYNLPNRWIKHIGLSDSRLFLSGENLWTWSPLYKITKDIDPESINGSDRVLTDGRSGNGYNYPILKTVTIGLSATF